MSCKNCRKEKIDLKCSCGKILVFGGNIKLDENNKVVVCKHCGKHHGLELIKTLIRVGAERVL